MTKIVKEDKYYSVFSYVDYGHRNPVDESKISFIHNLYENAIGKSTYTFEPCSVYNRRPYKDRSEAVADAQDRRYYENHDTTSRGWRHTYFAVGAVNFAGQMILTAKDFTNPKYKPCEEPLTEEIIDKMIQIYNGNRKN